MDGNATNSGGTTSSTATENNSIANNHAEQPQTKRQRIEKIKTNGKHLMVITNKKAITSSSPDIIESRDVNGIDGNGNTNNNSNSNNNSNNINNTDNVNNDNDDNTDDNDNNSNNDNNNNNNNNISNNNTSNHNNSRHICSSLSSSSSHSLSTPSTTNNSPTSTPCSSRSASFAQLLNVQNLVNNILPTTTTPSTSNKISSLSSTTIEATESRWNTEIDLRQSSDEVDCVSTNLPDLLTMTQNISATTINCSNKLVASTATTEDMREFENSLSKQCLCGVSERTLQKPFQSHYSLDVNGHKRIANLSEWPTDKLMQFLSNLQLLFDIYLKQNSKGFICARIMDVCDALIRNDHNLIDEIIVLASYNNAYVQFLAGRVLAAFLVIAKQELNDDWLRKIVDNLFNFDCLNQSAVQKIHFSLDIIKRIVEWKDVELHPLEDEVPASSPSTTPAASLGALPELNTIRYMHFPAQQPSLENNYFAVHFRASSDEDEVQMQALLPHPSISNSRVDHGLPQHLNELDELYGFNTTSVTESTNDTSHLRQQQQHRHRTPPAAPATTFINNGCHIVTLTDSESFDTSHLKCVTIQKLENKWPALVKNMSALMSTGNQLNNEHVEHCILNFLQLWENIISVKANLSIDETRPFYAQLDKFELLLNQNLTCSIYKQMLCLFNEALCYGSTLALQDMLPDETCMLAHQIVRHVKDFSILESLPRRQPENIVSLIGFQRQPILYEYHSMETHTAPDNLAGSDAIEMDKTILQKMVLLVLKSVAVTVKEIRSDSSDSSIDSTDYDAYHDMLLIERSIRDVISKLESFIKHTLEFHPECHFSKILIHLFDDQDDHLIESMVCTLDVTSGISFRNNAFPELVSMLNPVYTFLEFLKMTSNSSDLLLDLLVSNETCFLLYLLRFLKYIRMNWSMFVQSCNDFGMGTNTLDEAMGVLIRLRLQITRLVSRQLYPYDISPVLRLLESCESLYEGNELS